MCCDLVPRLGDHVFCSFLHKTFILIGNNLIENLLLKLQLTMSNLLLQSLVPRLGDHVFCSFLHKTFMLIGNNLIENLLLKLQLTMSNLLLQSLNRKIKYQTNLGENGIYSAHSVMFIIITDGSHQPY